MDPLPPENTELGRLANPAGTGLGSLAQSARSKKLKQARGILIAVGILTIIVNGIGLALLPSQVKNELDKEINKVKAQRMVVDQAKVKEVEAQILRYGYLASGVVIGLGVVFVILGLIVNQYPVPATLLGLVLYIGAVVILALLDPITIAQGIIWKIIIIACLLKALQTAIAYEKEKTKERSALEAGM